MHQIALFKKKFSGGGIPPTPLARRMALQCAACCIATCKFPKVKENFLVPLAKSWLRPC